VSTKSGQHPALAGAAEPQAVRPQEVFVTHRVVWFIAILLPTVGTSFLFGSKPDKPVPFGYKVAWLAIRSEKPREVAEALGLVKIQDSAWSEGLQAAGRGDVFVSPPVQGWVLVVSSSLPDAGDGKSTDKCTPLLSRLGKRFPDVQYFATHRVVEYHAWARLKNGVVVRQFAYLGERGEVSWDNGSQTPEEVQLGFKFDAEKGFYPDEEDVLHLAEAWSINPMKLDALGLAASLGLAGRLPDR